MMQKEEKAKGGVSLKVIFSYIKAMGGKYGLGGLVPFLILFIILIVTQIAITSGDWWLSIWTGLSFNEQYGNAYNQSVMTNFKTNETKIYDPALYNNTCPTDFVCYNELIPITWDYSYQNETLISKGLTQLESVYIYITIGLIAVIFTFSRDYSIMNFALNAAKNLHNNAFIRVIRAPLAYFDTTPLGRIVTRFSTDIIMIDDILVRGICVFLGLLLNVFGYIFIMLYTTNGLFILALIPLAILYFIIYQFYRKSSIELGRLNAVSRSPLFAHFSETLNNGMPTIRAYQVEKNFIDDNQNRINVNHRAYMMMMSAQRWLVLRLHMIGDIVVLFIGALCIILYYYGYGFLSIEKTIASFAISYSINWCFMMNLFMQRATEIEVWFNSVERLIFYLKNVPNEKPAIIKDTQPHQSWPEHGEIEFKNYALRYRPELPLALKDCSFTIKPKEKIGVVGRTGAGKSTLMLALFRLTEPANGTIYIDDIDITQIGLDALRNNISIIPQDPVLFYGDIKSNLDPFNKYSDEKIWDALEKSYLKEKIMKTEFKLKTPVLEGGSNFSVGERQLLCLARAILENAKILVLDEATASVDLNTDKDIQETIRVQFADKTCLTIAHRLDTIIESTRVLVMDKGLVAEYDTPKNLLTNKKYHIFKELINETGKSNARKLFQLATGEKPTDEDLGNQDDDEHLEEIHID